MFYFPVPVSKLVHVYFSLNFVSTDESSAVTSFLTLLSQWDRPEIEEKLCQRVEFSKRAIGKLLQAYDRLMQKNEKLWDAIKEKEDDTLAGRLQSIICIIN